MAASTAPRYDLQRVAPAYWNYPVAASTKIYYGTMVAVNSSGYLVPAADTSGLSFVGIAQPNTPGGVADNSAGASGGEVSCPVAPIMDQAPGQRWSVLNCSGADHTWINQHVFASDDHTVTLAGGSTNKVGVGKVIEVISATAVKVDHLASFAVASS